MSDFEIITIDVKKIRGLLRRYGITQEELAYRVNRTPAHISRILCGYVHPSNQTLVAIADVLNSQSGDLLSRERYVSKNRWRTVQEIWRICKRLNISQAELGKRTGYSQSSLSKILSGQRLLNNQMLINIAKALEVEVDILINPPSAKIELSLEQVQIKVNEITEELIRYLDKHPESMYKMSPRKFERLIAELLRDMGYDVQLTPETRDGGRDILAGIQTNLGDILALIECKRYAPKRLIGPKIVERFLWTIEHRDRASFGIIATTSFFTSGAKTIEDEFKWKLKLRDYENLREWLSNYGKWSKKRREQLWLPNSLTNEI